MERLNKKLFLEEPIEELPDAQIEEPIVVSTEPSVDDIEITPENNLDAFVSMLNEAISNEWIQIETVKSYITTMTSMLSKEEVNEDVIAILNQIIDEKTMHVGMYQKAIELLDISPSILINKGEDKAEDIVSEK